MGNARQKFLECLRTKTRKGPVLWCSELSHCLWCQHSIWVLVQDPVSLPLIQLPADGLGREQTAPIPLWKTWKKLLALTWPSPSHCGYLESGPVDKSILVLFLAPLLPPVILPFKLKSHNNKKREIPQRDAFST